jgi:hypothetical protein
VVEALRRLRVVVEDGVPSFVVAEPPLQQIVQLARPRSFIANQE